MAAEELLIGLTGVVVAGVLGLWLAWRLHVPSILVLLAVGFLAGPILKFLDPDALLGDGFRPFVALAVSIILFEGGLSLKLSEIRGHGRVVTNLITVGVVVTWALSALLGHYVAGLVWDVALLLGAVFVVTGPTVIGPLLRHVRPSGQGGSVVRWEGILNDPVGAILAVIVFETVVAGTLSNAAGAFLFGVARSLLIGILVGGVAAFLLVVVIARRWVPDFLQVPLTLGLVVTSFTTADVLQPESGLLAVTLMGVGLANQKRVAVKHIYSFKENLSLLLIAVLFILLAARLRLEHVAVLGWGSLAFLAALLLLVRPAAVLASTWGSTLSWRDRVFVAWMAPRGIVAAAVASFFALRLEETGHPQADRIVPLTFLVIVGTVTLYGLTAAPVARALGIAGKDPQGVLIVDADPFSRGVARALCDHGYRVVLVDTNAGNVRAAHEEGLEAERANVLAEDVLEQLDLTDVGRLLALTPNDEVNALAALYFTDAFGGDNVYQLPPRTSGSADHKELGGHLRGRRLFDDQATHDRLRERVEAGDEIVTARPGVSVDALESVTGGPVVPLFLIREDGSLDVVTARGTLTVEDGEHLVYLGRPEGNGD